MEVVESLSKVSSEFLDSVFREFFILFDELAEISTGTVLKDNPKMVPGLVPIVELEDVSVFESMEHPNFVVYFLPPTLFNRFHSHIVDGLLLSSLVDN
jgi:hypothetical protein